MTVDPACGLVVDENTEAEALVYRDQKYVFCSAECRAAFVRNPSGYLKEPPPRVEAPSPHDGGTSDLA